MANRLRFIRSVIYRLKRDYGLRADIYHLSGETIDLATGVKSHTKTKFTINRMILLPVNNLQQKDYDTSFTSANRNFTYGALFGTGTRHMIIDRRDIPSNVDLTSDYVNRYIVFRNERYQIEEIRDYEEQAAYFIIAKKLEGSPTAEFIELDVETSITATGDESTTLNGQPVTSTITVTPEVAEVVE